VIAALASPSVLCSRSAGSSATRRYACNIIISPRDAGVFRARLLVFRNRMAHKDLRITHPPAQIFGFHQPAAASITSASARSIVSVMLVADPLALGTRLHALRENRWRASLGIDTNLHAMAVFDGSALGGVAGTLYARSPNMSIRCLQPRCRRSVMMVIVGGAGFFFGPFSAP